MTGREEDKTLSSLAKVSKLPADRNSFLPHTVTSVSYAQPLQVNNC